MKTTIIKTIIGILLIVMLLAGCTSKLSVVQDISKVDFVALNLTSDQLTVEGIALGMTYDEVNKIRGYPQGIDDYFDQGATNYFYKENNVTMFVVNFKRGHVDRITLSPDYTKLINQSAYGRDKTTIYADFGIANQFIDQGKIRRFIYNQKGYEVLLKAKEHIGYSFFKPNEYTGDHKVFNSPLVNNSINVSNAPVVDTNRGVINPINTTPSTHENSTNVSS